jgi:hypothetical protein
MKWIVLAALAFFCMGALAPAQDVLIDGSCRTSRVN